jgi:hypothetical protein
MRLDDPALISEAEVHDAVVLQYSSNLREHLIWIDDMFIDVIEDDDVNGAITQGQQTTIGADEVAPISEVAPRMHQARHVNVNAEHITASGPEGVNGEAG